MTSPRGGFDGRGEDEVAARLSVDVPAESLNNLQQLSRETRDLRTNLEATARASGDYAAFLRQLPDLLRTAATAQEQYLAAASSSFGGPATLGGGRQHILNRMTSGLMRPAPEAPEAAPRDEAARQREGGTGRAMGGQLDELRARDPRQYANLLAQHGREAGSDRPSVPPGPDSDSRPPRSSQDPPRPSRDGGGGSRDWLREAEQYEQSGTGLMSRIMAQFQAGGRSNLFEIGAAGVQGFRRMAGGWNNSLEERIAAAEAEAAQLSEQAHTIDDAGNTILTNPAAASAARTAAQRAAQLGSLQNGLGMAVRGAGVAGLAVGGVMAAQQGGEFVQGFRAQGAVRGGGAAEGFAFEMGIRQMAMNPFIDVEQSRRIMQTALNEGYTGKEFETLTQFMAENLRDLNMQTAESMRSVKTLYERGGMSMEEIATQMRQTSEMTQREEVAITAEQARAGVEKVSTAAVGQGMGGTEAVDYGQAMTAMYAESPILADLGPALGAAAFSPSVTPFQQYVASQTNYQGNPLGALPTVLEGENGNEEAARLQGEFLDMHLQPYLPMFASGDRGTQIQAVNDAAATLSSILGTQVTTDQAREFLRIAAEEGGNAAYNVGAYNRQREHELGGDPTTPGWGQKLGDVGSLAQSMVEGGVIGQGAKWLGKLTGIDSLEKWGQEHFDANEEQVAEYNALASARAYNPQIRKLITDSDSYAGDIMVRGEDGSETDLLDAINNNPELVKQLAAGSAEVRMPGQEYTTLDKVNLNEPGTEGKGTTVVELGDYARRYFEIMDDGRNSNQYRSDKGEDGASRNDPPAEQDRGGG